MQQRLQKILSAAGIASRRAAESLHHAGPRDGQRQDGHRARVQGGPGRRRHQGRRPSRSRRPARRSTSCSTSRAATSRADPIPSIVRRSSTCSRKGGVRDYVYPVGRLDFDSEGLLLLTSDGDLAARLTHPSHGVEREYEVKVLGVPDDHELERLARGSSIDGRRTAPADVKRSNVQSERDRAAHPVARSSCTKDATVRCASMCEAIGHPVVG